MPERAVDSAETDHRRLRLEPGVVGDTRDVLDAASFFVAVELERERSRRSRKACALLVATTEEGGAARLAQILRNTLRQIDVVGRIDLSRVAVLLPYTTEKEACSLQAALTRDFDPLNVDVTWGIGTPQAREAALARADSSTTDPSGRAPLRLVPRKPAIATARRSSSRRLVTLLAIAALALAFLPIAWRALAR